MGPFLSLFQLSNQTFEPKFSRAAKKFFGNEDPIGKHVSLGRWAGITDAEVIGITGGASTPDWILEEVARWEPQRIRALFESHGFVFQEWEKVRTDWLTIRGNEAAASSQAAA